VDMNFSITSLRNRNEDDIKERFKKVYNEDKMLALKWIFYVRDCRKGVGERRLFRICLDYLANEEPEVLKALINLIPEYGRWDDLLELLESNLEDHVFNIIKKQLDEDKNNMKNNQPISLCAKWMPSINSSSKKTRKLAKILVKKFNYTESKYRKMLSSLRSYSNVIEVLMSAKKWEEINYSSVPSKANLIYSKAFLKNDEERRKEFLEQLKNGEVKINASVLFPHDIVHKYHATNEVDDTLESLWKNLPDYVQGNGNTICVADSSGSMICKASKKSSVTCLEVANSLAIYFSEKSTGRFKDLFITFSSHPEFVDLSPGHNLKEKIKIAESKCFMENTNIEGVFDLILRHAIENKLPSSELPTNILILSDCEFDSMVDFGSFRGTNEALFDTMMKKYKENGYLLPRLIFWNINSRSETIPIKKNDMGVALVSGFSPAIVKMVLSDKTEPYESLLEQLNNERYQPIEDAVKDILK